MSTATTKTLADVSEGDQVLSAFFRGPKATYSLRRVVKATPSRIAVGGDSFDRDGRPAAMPGFRKALDHARLYPAHGEHWGAYQQQQREVEQQRSNHERREADRAEQLAQIARDYVARIKAADDDEALELLEDYATKSAVGQLID